MNTELDVMAADLLETAIRQAQSGSADMYRDILADFRKAVEDGAVDARLAEFAFGVLDNPDVIRTIFPQETVDETDQPAFERDLLLSRDVVRRKRHALAHGEDLNEVDAFAITAKVHGVSELMVEQAFKAAAAEYTRAPLQAG